MRAAYATWHDPQCADLTDGLSCVLFCVILQKPAGRRPPANLRRSNSSDSDKTTTDQPQQQRAAAAVPAAASVSAEEVALRQELGAMKLMGLQKRALGAGVSEDELEDAMEADEPKAALISLIVLSELSSRAVVAAEPAAAEFEQQQGVDTWQDNEDEEGQVSDGGKKKKGKKSKNKSPTAAEIAAVRQTEQNRKEKKKMKASFPFATTGSGPLQKEKRRTQKDNCAFSFLFRTTGDEEAARPVPAASGGASSR
jgi:hypothetical protein